MKIKRLLALAAAISMIFTATAAFAENGHTHDWLDDIENSTETTNAYICECGETKLENVDEVRDYVITVDANGGVVDTPTLTTKNGKIKLPIAHNDSDYQFIGWFTELSGGIEITSATVFEEDTTIYAQWEIISTRRLVFATDGGSDILAITETYGKTVSLESYIPTKQGYIFDGWYADPQGKQQKLTEFTFDEDDVIYAKWIIDENATQATSPKDPIYLTDEEIAEKTKQIIAEKANSTRYIAGYGDVFKPDQAITRYEMLECLYELFNIKKSDTDKTFSDVSEGKKALVDLFAGAGIIDGFDDGTFKGDNGLTRAEFSKVMSIILECDSVAENSRYADIQGHWAEGYISQFTLLGYLVGYEDGSFRPDNQMTRAEFVTIINRIVKIENELYSKSYTDLAGEHWAYEDIMKACKEF